MLVSGCMLFKWECIKYGGVSYLYALCMDHADSVVKYGPQSYILLNKNTLRRHFFLVGRGAI